MTDFRALVQSILDCAEEHLSSVAVDDEFFDVLARARAYLAQHEPAGPMTADFRALCAELLEWLELADNPPAEVVVRVRAALAEPDPVADFVASQVPMPDDMRDALSAPGALWSLYEGAALAEGAGVGPITAEPRQLDWFIEFAQWLAREMPAGTVIGDPQWWAPRIARAAIRRFLASPTHPRPIPVAERPWEQSGFLDDNGDAWFDQGDDVGWMLCDPVYALRHGSRFCLPAAAIPLPEGNNA